jgi:hypothetical protein
LLALYRALLALALALGALILGGTLYAGFRRSGGDQAGPAAGGEAVFTGIGRLRIPLAPAGNSPAAPSAAAPFPAGGSGAERPLPEGQTALVIFITFPYSPRDQAFAEELASKAGDFRRIAVDYFSPRSAEELRALDEEEIRAGLLGVYNSVLRLGKIGTLYFNELLILE